MPPAFFLPPPVPGQPTSAMGYMYDDVWDEVADREYAGYGCLGSIQASTTLTPTPDARLTESSDYGFPSSSSLKPVGYTDYRSPAAPGYRDDERLAGRGKVENSYGVQEKRRGGGKEEMDWMDKYRKPSAASASSTSSPSTATTKNSFLAPPSALSAGNDRRQSPSSSIAASSSTSASSPPSAHRSSNDQDNNDADGESPEGEGRRRYSIDEDQYGERYSDLWR